jgi:hypothetical protein
MEYCVGVANLEEFDSVNASYRKDLHGNQNEIKLFEI